MLDSVNVGDLLLYNQLRSSTIIARLLVYHDAEILNYYFLDFNEHVSRLIFVIAASANPDVVKVLCSGQVFYMSIDVLLIESKRVAP